MTPEQKRIAIAGACTEVFVVNRFSDGKIQIIHAINKDACGPSETFDPLSDLNAMHEAVASLPENQQWEWQEILVGVMRSEKGPMANATAAQRADAFLKTLNLLKE